MNVWDGTYFNGDNRDSCFCKQGFGEYLSYVGRYPGPVFQTRIDRDDFASRGQGRHYCPRKTRRKQCHGTAPSARGWGRAGRQDTPPGTALPECHQPQPPPTACAMVTAPAENKSPPKRHRQSELAPGGGGVLSPLPSPIGAACITQKASGRAGRLSFRCAARRCGREALIGGGVLVRWWRARTGRR